MPRSSENFRLVSSSCLEGDKAECLCRGEGGGTCETFVLRSISCLELVQHNCWSVTNFALDGSW